jgi:hypothetical protein
MNQHNDIIKTSVDKEVNSKVYPYDPSQKDIDIRENPYSIYDILRQCKEGRIIVKPELQKKNWVIAKKSYFIESVLLGFPLSPFYVSQTREGRLIIIDGLQRMAALQEFTADKFSLTELKALTHLNEKNFSDLKKCRGLIRSK